MQIKNNYWYYTGTVRGTIAYGSLDTSDKLQFEKSDEPSEVTALEWVNTDQIVSGFSNGNIYLFDTVSSKYVNKIKHLENKIVGVGSINNEIISCTNTGDISIFQNNKEKDNLNIELKTDSTVECFTQNKYTHNVVAVGGIKSNLQLWDIEAKQCIFKAKSLGHDSLNLPIQSSIRGITYIQEDSNVCCCTKEGHILLYDSRTQKKPVKTFFDQRNSYTTITCANREKNILAGTTKGFIQYLDMRQSKFLKSYTNINGSVTSIYCDPVEPHVACVSLDKFLRIYNLETRELLHKHYIKQSLTKLLVKPIIKKETETEETNETNLDEEYEEIFDNMQVIMDKTKKHKIKDNQGNVQVKHRKKPKI